jgi:polysaccharide export outer membrane protein
MNDPRSRIRRQQWFCWTVFLFLPMCLLHQSLFQAAAQEEAVAPRSQGGNVSIAAGESAISPDDVLDVYVMDVPELSRQYRVGPDGTVIIPLLDRPLVAAGSKAAVFAETLSRELRKQGLVTQPHVTVSIASSRLKSVAITGAVRMPQLYPVLGRTTLLDLLSQAQGLEENASNVAVISRGEANAQVAGSEPRVVTVDLKKLLDGADPSYNLVLYPGDRVTVPRAGMVYVVGAVNKPGGYPIRSAGDGMTILQAVALAGNVKSTGVPGKAMVIRPDPSARDGHKQLPVNLKRILAAQSADPSLQAGDILFVPDSASAKALRRGIEAALETVTLLAAYGHL